MWEVPVYFSVSVAGIYIHIYIFFLMKEQAIKIILTEYNQILPS